MQREESKHEELERQKLEREQMRLAITAYTGPITECPRGKSTSDPYGDADRHLLGMGDGR